MIFVWIGSVYKQSSIIVLNFVQNIKYYEQHLRFKLIETDRKIKVMKSAVNYRFGTAWLQPLRARANNPQQFTGTRFRRNVEQLITVRTWDKQGLAIVSPTIQSSLLITQRDIYLIAISWNNRIARAAHSKLKPNQQHSLTTKMPLMFQLDIITIILL